MQDCLSHNFYLVNLVKNGEGCIASVNCITLSYSNANSFIQFYTKDTNETLKLKFKKEETDKTIQKKKQFRNTSRPFQVTFKVLKVANE